MNWEGRKLELSIPSKKLQLQLKAVVRQCIAMQSNTTQGQSNTKLIEWYKQFTMGKFTLTRELSGKER